MSAPYVPVLGAARTRRDRARAQALAAIHAWAEAVLDAVRTLADVTGIRGPDRMVVFHGRSMPVPDAGGNPWPGEAEQCGELRDSLLSAVLADATGQLTLAPGGDRPAAWAEAVDVWDDLRAALSRSYLMHVPVGILVDLDQAIIACYEAIHCPQIGPDAQLVLDLSTPAEDADPRDPFEKMLSAAADALAAERTAAEWNQRLERLLDAYQLELPTAPHADGDCSVADED